MEDRISMVGMINMGSRVRIKAIVMKEISSREYNNMVNLSLERRT